MTGVSCWNTSKRSSYRLHVQLDQRQCLTCVKLIVINDTRLHHPFIHQRHDSEWVLSQKRIFTISVRKRDKTAQIGITPQKSGWLNSSIFFRSNTQNLWPLIAVSSFCGLVMGLVLSHKSLTCFSSLRILAKGNCLLWHLITLMSIPVLIFYFECIY